MHKINKKSYCVVIYTIFALFGLSFFCSHATAESYTFKAPDTFYSVKLTQEDQYYSYSPFSSFNFKLEGWACGEKYADKTIFRIREINRLIQPLAEAKDALDNLEKVLVQMGKEKLITLTKSNVQNAVYTAIGNSIKKVGFTSEKSFIEKAESLARDTIEDGKSINRIFGYSEDRDIFQNVQYGTPSGIWQVSKMEPDEPSSVVFVAQNCYQKQDIEAMVSAIVNAARKLDEALKSYKDTKDKVLAIGK